MKDTKFVVEDGENFNDLMIIESIWDLNENVEEDRENIWDLMMSESLGDVRESLGDVRENVNDLMKSEEKKAYDLVQTYDPLQEQLLRNFQENVLGKPQTLKSLAIPLYDTSAKEQIDDLYRCILACDEPTKHPEGDPKQAFCAPREKIVKEETRVVCIKLNYIRKPYRNLRGWMEDEDNVYIDRKLATVVEGRKFPMLNSKWYVPFARDKEDSYFLERYCKYILQCLDNGRITLRDLAELKGKNLGCWCEGRACHGDVLVNLIKCLIP